MADIIMIAVYMTIPAIFALMGGIYLGIRLRDKRYMQAQEAEKVQETGE